jgi:hypothetical protein
MELQGCPTMCLHMHAYNLDVREPRRLLFLMVGSRREDFESRAWSPIPVSGCGGGAVDWISHTRQGRVVLPSLV